MAANSAAVVELEEPLRVLIIDDNPLHQRFAREEFEATKLKIEFSFAETYTDGLNLLFHEYFDIAVIDLVLSGNDREPIQEWEGFGFLQEIYDRGFHEDIAVILNSAFAATTGVAQEAFSNFRLTDMWDKHFSPAQATQRLKVKLEAQKYFGLRSTVDFESGLDWSSLVELLKIPFYKVSVYLDADQTQLELRHLIRRLFLDATSLHISPMGRGLSDSAVVKVTPYQGPDQGADVVVKYGPLNSIRREFEGWRLVSKFINGYKATRIQHKVLGRHLAALQYTLLGANLTEIVPFAKFYPIASADDIAKVFEQLFLETCSLLYKNMTVEPNMDFEKAYMGYLGLRPDSLRTPYSFRYPEWPLDDENGLRFAELPRPLINPVGAYCSGEATVIGRCGVCLTHGDLHGDNIFIAKDSHDSWLIDFGRSGYGHWARDFAELETAIKFQMMQSTDLPSLFEFEDALASMTALDATPDFNRDDKPDLQKAFLCIINLRKLAAKVSAATLPADVALSSYLGAIFYQTLNYIRLQKLIKGGQRKNHVLISAALVLEKINALQEISVIH